MMLNILCVFLSMGSLYSDCPSGLLSQLTRAVFTNFDDCVQLSEYYTQAFDISSNNQHASENSQDSSEDDIDGNIRPPRKYYL